MIYMYMSLGPWGLPGFKVVSFTVTRMPFSICRAQRVSGMDESTTQFYENRLTAAPSLCSLGVSRDLTAGKRWHYRAV